MLVHVKRVQKALDGLKIVLKYGAERTNEMEWNRTIACTTAPIKYITHIRTKNEKPHENTCVQFMRIDGIVDVITRHTQFLYESLVHVAVCCIPLFCADVTAY